MTIQDLGSVGEVLAAIATLATLIYLARQIRQNSAAVEAAAAQSVLVGAISPAFVQAVNEALEVNDQTL